MKFSSHQIKKAWKIRKDAAIKFDCKIMEILWAPCLKLAKEQKMNLIGSEKQIVWASDIISRFIAFAGKVNESHDEHGFKENMPANEEDRAAFVEFIERVRSLESVDAGWVIEYQDSIFNCSYPSNIIRAANGKKRAQRKLQVALDFLGGN